MLDPVFAINYGVSGVGKSTDMIYAFPDNAIIFGERNAVRAPARSVVGVEIADSNIIQPNRIEDASDYIEKNHESLRKRGIIAAIADDFSLLAQNTFDHYEREQAKTGKKDGYFVINSLVDEIHRFRNVCRRASIHVFVNAHDGPRHLNKNSGRYINGGPKLPGQIQEDIGQAFDVVLHVVRNPTRPVGFKAEFHCGVDSDYTTKDRLNIVDGVMPFNTAEYLRAAGYEIPRACGLEWMEPVVEHFATFIVTLGQNIVNPQVMLQVGNEMRAALAQKTSDPRHVNWVIRDAYDRAFIRVVLANRRQLGM